MLPPFLLPWIWRPSRLSGSARPLFHAVIMIASSRDSPFFPDFSTTPPAIQEKALPAVLSFSAFSCHSRDRAFRILEFPCPILSLEFGNLTLEIRVLTPQIRDFGGQNSWFWCSKFANLAAKIQSVFTFSPAKKDCPRGTVLFDAILWFNEPAWCGRRPALPGWP